MLRNNSKTVRGIIHVENISVEKRKGCSGKDLQIKKVLSLERKSDWVRETNFFSGQRLSSARSSCRQTSEWSERSFAVWGS